MWSERGEVRGGCCKVPEEIHLPGAWPALSRALLAGRSVSGQIADGPAHTWGTVKHEPGVRGPVSVLLVPLDCCGQLFMGGPRQRVEPTSGGRLYTRHVMYVPLVNSHIINPK